MKILEIQKSLYKFFFLPHTLSLSVVMSQSRAGLQSLPRPFPSLSFVCVSGKNILVHILHLIINRSIISASLTFLSLSSRRHVYLSLSQ